MISVNSKHVEERITKQGKQVEVDSKNTKKNKNNIEFIKKQNEIIIYDEAIRKLKSNISTQLKIEEKDLEQIKNNIEKLEAKIKKEKLKLDEITIKECLINKYHVVRNQKDRKSRRNNIVGFCLLGGLFGTLPINNMIPEHILFNLTTCAVAGMTVAIVKNTKEKKSLQKESSELLTTPLTQKALPNEKQILSTKRKQKISILSDYIIEKAIKEEAYFSKDKKEDIEKTKNSPKEKPDYILDNVDKLNDRRIEQKVIDAEIDHILDSIDTLIPNENKTAYQKVKHI